MDITSRKRKLLILTTIIVVVFFGALFLEGAARLYVSIKGVDPAVPGGIGQFDEILGWSLKPLSRATSNRTGYKIEYHINSKGLRDDETAYEKPEGKFRIVLVGDSRTFGFGVPIEKHFSTLLEGYFKNVEAINMGVGGFGVDQELLSLRSEGFRYAPDLVLAYVAHYGEHRHMHAERFGKKKPRFLLIDGKLALTNSPVVDSQNTLRKIDAWFERNSKAYGILYNRLVGLISQTQLSSKQQDEQNSKDEAFQKELHALGAAIIYAMHEDSSKQGAIFVLVTQVEALHQATLDKQILSLDVSRPLSNNKFSLPDDLGHINEAGNGVLAWEIANFLETNRLIPVKHLQDRNLNGDS
jgi:hypothetical protein